MDGLFPAMTDSSSLQSRRYRFRPINAPTGEPELEAEEDGLVGTSEPAAPPANKVSTQSAPVEDDGFTAALPQVAIPQETKNQVLSSVMPKGPAPLTSATDQMRVRGDILANEKPRPANLSDIDPSKVHHGGRKFLDNLLPILAGAATFNPYVGIDLHNRMSRAPLRDAQSGWDSQHEQNKESFENATKLAGAQTAADRVSAMQQHYENQGEKRETEITKMKEQFVLGSERPDATSPTGWVAQTVGGETKPYTPKSDHTQTSAEKDAAIREERMKTAKAMKLDDADTKFYVLNGKLREPGAQTNIHMPSADATEYQDWKRAYKAEHGKDPDAKAIEGYKRGVKADTTTAPYMRSPEAFRDHYDNQAHGEYAVLQKAYDHARAKAVKDNSDDQEAIKTAVAAVDADFANRKSKIDDKKAADAEKFGQNVQPSDYSYLNGGKKPAATVPAKPQAAAAVPAAPAPTAAPVPQAQPASAPSAPAQGAITTQVTKQQVKVGDVVYTRVGGPPHKVTRISKSGKPVVSPI